MKRFDGMLICTDLDGTLLRNDGTISKENIEAIEYFKQNGGYFSFVTGRMPFFVSHIHNAINPNAPFGCINGGGLYDYNEKKYIWTAPMAEGVNVLIEHIDKEFPNVGIQVNTFEHTYFCKENETMKYFRRITGLPNLVQNYNDITETVSKIIFGIEEEDEILAVEKSLRNHPLAQNFDFVRSERTLFEILPKGINKGVSVTKLAEYLNIDINKTIAIGDYNNDIPMFKAAKIGISVKNACPDALKAADFVTVSNEEHAIAQLISDLEKGKFNEIL